MYLRAKFEVSSIILTNFRQRLIPPATPQTEPLKSPPRLRLIMFYLRNIYISLFLIHAATQKFRLRNSENVNINITIFNPFSDVFRGYRSGALVENGLIRYFWSYFLNPNITCRYYFWPIICNCCEKLITKGIEDFWDFETIFRSI